MYTQSKYSNYSVDEYLRLDLESRCCHEYVAGQVYIRTVVNNTVKLITENLLTRLRTHLIGTDYRVFSSDMKLKIEPLNIFYHPQISVICDSKDREKFFKTRPCLIVEVVSPDTERIFRNEKLMNYRQLPTLQEYVLVWESQAKVEIYRKYNQDNWLVQTLSFSGDTIKLSSVDLEVAMEEIYEDVAF